MPPPHAVSQHTPSTQKPVVHSVADVQLLDTSSSVAVALVSVASRTVSVIVCGVGKGVESVVVGPFAIGVPALEVHVQVNGGVPLIRAPVSVIGPDPEIVYVGAVVGAVMDARSPNEAALNVVETAGPMVEPCEAAG